MTGVLSDLQILGCLPFLTSVNNRVWKAQFFLLWLTELQFVAMLMGSDS